MYAESRESVGHDPPYRSATRARHMKLPQTDPARPSIVKNPSIVYEEPKYERNLCGEESTDHQGRFEDRREEI